MTAAFDRDMVWLFTGVLSILVVASAIGLVLKKRTTNDSARDVVNNLNARIRAWWIMCAIFALAVLTGGVGSLVLFGLISFAALREFITLTPTRPGDHRTLFWSFFIITPLQYYLIGVGWYGLFSILIPVYAFLFVPIRSVLTGDTESFLERIAKIQWGLMVCVYCVSYVPALLTLEIDGYENQNAKLLFYFVLIVQLSDVLQYVWGKWLGRRRIAPEVSPNKTWEGFIGGVISATIVGTLLWWATPFDVLAAASMSLVATLMGFAGGLTMSAIKRDRGVKDYGTLIEGHGGMLDRIDSVCFAAPIFFHMTRYFYTN